MNDTSPAELYHENSKSHRSDRLRFAWIQFVTTSADVGEIITHPAAQYRGHPEIALPGELLPTRPFEEVVTARRSVRGYSGAPMTLAALGKILHCGDGLSHSGSRFRTAPSAGGLFPIELSCFALRVNGLSSGLYSYNPERHSLVTLSEGDHLDALAGAAFLDDAARRACACVVLTAMLPRVRFKYGERGYRFALLEAGHIAQNLLLAAEAEGLAAVPLGGFVDDEVHRLLNIDGVDEVAVYLVLIGARGPAVIHQQ